MPDAACEPSSLEIHLGPFVCSDAISRVHKRRDKFREAVGLELLVGGGNQHQITCRVDGDRHSSSQMGMLAAGADDGDIGITDCP